jgi:hypothetical protein
MGLYREVIDYDSDSKVERVLRRMSDKFRFWLYLHVKNSKM